MGGLSDHICDHLSSIYQYFLESQHYDVPLALFTQKDIYSKRYLERYLLKRYLESLSTLCEMPLREDRKDMQPI